MKLSDAIAACDSYSGKTSDIVRQLSLAGIAVVWVFKSSASPDPQLDPKLIKASLFIVAALLLDLIQYFSSFTIWFIYVRYKERKQFTPDSDIFPRPSINWLNLILFYAKCFTMLIAYGCYILPYLHWRFLK